MILSEKFKLSEKLILTEAEDTSKKIDDGFNSAASNALQALRNAAKVLNKKDDKNSAINEAKALSSTSIRAIASLRTKNTATSVKKGLLQDVMLQLTNIINAPSLARNTEIKQKLTTEKAALDSFMVTDYSADAYEEAADVLQRVINICSEIEMRSDASSIADDQIFDRAGSIIQHAVKQVTELDETTKVKLVTSFKSLVTGLVSASEDIEAQQTICTDFINTWESKFDTNLADAEKMSDTGKDWETEYDNSGDQSKTWEDFVRSTFGNVAQFVLNIGPNLKQLCINNGFTAEANPFLAFVQNVALKNNNSNYTIVLQLNSSNFYAIIAAYNKQYITDKDLTGETKSINQNNILYCPELYKLSQEQEIELLGMQHDLHTNIVNNTVLSPKTEEAKNIVDTCNVKVGEPFGQNNKAIDAILYSTVASKLRSVGVVRQLLGSLFGAHYSKKNYVGDDNVDKAKDTVNKYLATGAGANNLTAEERYIKLKRLLYAVYYYFTQDGKYTEANNYFIKGTAQFNKLMLTNEEVNELIDTLKDETIRISNHAVYGEMCRKYGITLDMLSSVIKVILHNIINEKKKINSSEGK